MSAYVWGPDPLKLPNFLVLDRDRLIRIRRSILYDPPWDVCSILRTHFESVLNSEQNMAVKTFPANREHI